MDRIIGLDVGDKTIGIAVSDGLLLTAQGVTTIERVGIRKDCDKVIAHIKERMCNIVVIGLPKNLNGTDSVQTEKVYEFRRMLENKMRSSGMKNVEIVYQDERFTTKIAEAVLIQADVSRKKRKDVIDKQAAVIILQSYLDRLDFKRRQALESESQFEGEDEFEDEEYDEDEIDFDDETQDLSKDENKNLELVEGEFTE